jgi:hypothetical protein
MRRGRSDQAQSSYNGGHAEDERALAREARLMTDENYMYRKIGRKFAEHSAVKHYEKEYVRGDVNHEHR